MNLTAYGHTFQNERDMNAYKQMKRQSVAKALERKKSMTPREKEDVETKRYMSGLAKSFRSKGFKV